MVIFLVISSSPTFTQYAQVHAVKCMCGCEFEPHLTANGPARIPVCLGVGVHVCVGHACVCGACMCMCIPLWVHVCVCVCVCACAHVQALMCAWMPVCAFVCVPVYAFVSACVIITKFV